MVANVDEKYKLLTEMKELSIQQTNCLSEDNIDAFDMLLNQKDVLIAKIDALDSSFYKYFQVFKADNGISDLSGLDKIEAENLKPLIQAVNRVEEIIVQIATVDKKNFEIATKLTNKYKEELKKVKTGRKMNNSYNVVDTDGIMYDEKG